MLIYISSTTKHKWSVDLGTIVSQYSALKSYPENKETEYSWYMYQPF